MSRRTRPDLPRRERRDRALLIVGLTIGVLFVLVLSLVVHFVLLRTDRFDWLEAPKRSSQSSTMHVA